MGKKILIPETVRCSDCRRKYHMGMRFPAQVRFDFQLPPSIDEETKDEILKHLSVTISSFSDYIYLAYGLDARTIEMQANFDIAPQVQAGDSWVAIEDKE